MRRQRAGGPALAVVVSLALAGCGSTVQTRAAQAGADSGLQAGADSGLGGSGLSGTAGPNAPVTGLGGGSGGQQPASLGGGLGGSSGGSAAGGGTSGGGSASGSSSGGAVPSGSSGGGAVTSGGGGGNVPGVTATAINIGFLYTKNGDAANAALGAGKITRGDPKADIQAAVDDVNAHGGVAGRKLVAIYHAYDAQSADTTASQDQAACLDLTQDHHVFAVGGDGLTDNITACLAKAGVMELSTPSPIIAADNRFYQQFPNYISISTISQERMMKAEVPSLLRQHYFTGWDATLAKPGPAPVKIGVISVDVPEWDRPLTHVLLPALAAAGHPVDASDVFKVHNPNSSSETGQLASDVQSATLRFRSDHVTHVIMLDQNGSLVLLFSNDAKSQHYYPRLGVNSGAGMQALYDAGVVDSTVLSGAVGLGWLPLIDLSASASKPFRNGASKHCLDVMTAKSITFSSANAEGIALNSCDKVYFVASAINRIGPGINAGTLRAAVEGMGSSFTSAFIPATAFSSARHDGAELGFDMAWNSTCNCAKYAGAGFHIGPAS